MNLSLPCPGQALAEENQRKPDWQAARPQQQFGEERVTRESFGFSGARKWARRLRRRRSAAGELKVRDVGREEPKRSYPTSKVRGSGQEELPHVQGKEQRLRFAGAAVKRYPTSKVRETQVRWWVLPDSIRGQTH